MMRRGGPPGSLEAMAAFEAEKPRDQRSAAGRLWQYISPYKRDIAITLSLVLVNAICQGLWPFLVGRSIDTYVTPNGDRAGNWSGLLQYALVLCVLFLVMWLTGRTQIVGMAGITQKTLLGLRRDIFAKVQRLPIAYFDKHPVGDVMSRLINDTDTINMFLGQGLIQILGGLFALVATMIAMLIQSPGLALASFIVIPVMVLTTNYFSKLAREAYRKTRSTIGNVSADLQEELAGAKVAQAFNRVDVNQRRFEERNLQNRNANMAATLITSAFTPLVDFLSVVATAIVAGLGGWMVIQGSLTVGMVVAFLAYVQTLFRPLQQLSTIYTQGQSSLAGAERIFDLVDSPNEEAADVGGTVTAQLPPIHGDVEFRDVSFAYDPAKPVLKRVSFKIEAGKTVAIVGPTGAGKTTIINLLARYYEPTHGAILVDGREIRQFTRTSLREQMGAVPQDSFLFTGSIKDNLKYGRIAASDEDMREAARASNAAEFIERNKDQYDTVLGERGSGLSQGQRQLIGIARAVLANPRILILDEATSSVDTYTESLIQKALNTLLKNRTSFVIAHRLSTIRDADLVLVLKDGEIVEQGNHEQLLALGGVYAELYQKQFRL